MERAYYEKISRKPREFVKTIRLEFNGNTPSFPRHWHKSVKIIYPVKGRAMLWLAGEIHEVCRGSYFLINSKTVHAFGGRGEDYEGYAVQIDLDYIRFLYPMIDTLSFLNRVGESDRGKIISALHELVSVDKSEYSDMAVNGYAAVLISRLLEGGDVLNDRRSVVKNRHAPMVYDIMNEIDRGYREKISPGTLAEKHNISYGYLARVFKESTGLTIGQYLNLQRLDHALLDMQCSELNLTRIALDNGFCDYKSFDKSFMEKYGMKPSQYRNRLDLPMERVTFWKDGSSGKQ
ncbi:MAG: helix-turn-helix transcriptional regulator [Spirochaetales bacterium]|nr:helix-turn-helix transcriptional regulator [Spirochaetales bacterium]